jgi:CxxC motif-containing protein (DUF1111 family)
MGTLNVRVLASSRAAQIRTQIRIVSAALALLFTGSANAQFFSSAHDPGVRGGTVDAGQAYSAQSLTAGQLKMFSDGKNSFGEIGSVQGKIPETDVGLGPRYNSVSCGSCHAQPALGGSSPSAKAFPNIGPNPQIAAANLQGATNRIPYFVRADGPVREARFKRVVRNGVLTDTADGGVHALYTITGRLDATNVVGATGVAQTCRLAQPDFDLMRRLDNIEFRIPTPVFGAGLIEAITDKAILDNMQAQSADKRNLGISGRPNRNGNDGTITRFGWKAQNISLAMFAGEAYNVEQGVTNELFMVERGSPGEVLPPECLFNGLPEDSTDPDTGASSDLVLFSMFMRFLAPPTPSTTSPGGATSIQRGATLFRDTVKCALCHTPSMPVGWSSLSRSIGPTQANLYSDLLLHDMGQRLADGVSQGAASGSEFRTAPLWGLGQRVFFLHDGRTNDLIEAIMAHGGRDSEARGTVDLFQRLSDTDKQHLLNFLRSL